MQREIQEKCLREEEEERGKRGEGRGEEERKEDEKCYHP